MGSYFDVDAPDVVLQSLFYKYDADKSGQLCRDELKLLFEEDLGFDEGQSEVYALLLDKDGNGQVSFDEFRSWLKSGEHFQNIDNESRYHRLRAAVELFNKYDADKSQSLDKREFKKLWWDLGGKRRDLGGAFKALDDDGSNSISFLEFLNWLNWIPMDEF